VNGQVPLAVAESDGTFPTRVLTTCTTQAPLSMTPQAEDVHPLASVTTTHAESIPRLVDQ